MCAGTTGQGLVDLLKELNARATMFHTSPYEPKSHQLECLKIGPPADHHQQQQQQQSGGSQQQQQEEGSQQQQQLGGGSQQEQQQEQQQQQSEGSQEQQQQQQQSQGSQQQQQQSCWGVCTFGAVKHELLPQQPLLQELQVLELYGLSEAQQEEVGVPAGWVDVGGGGYGGRGSAWGGGWGRMCRCWSCTGSVWHSRKRWVCMWCVGRQS
jgi:hypothetical protein